MSDRRTLLTDASVIVRLSSVGELPLLRAIDGDVVVPRAVESEVIDNPGAVQLSAGVDNRWITVTDELPVEAVLRAADHLEVDSVQPLEVESEDRPAIEGDTALLAHALSDRQTAVVVSDDKPLRETCKALSISVTGSIGILVRAVEVGEIDQETAVDRLYAMDEVGERLSASLIRRGERLIEDAST